MKSDLTISSMKDGHFGISNKDKIFCNIFVIYLYSYIFNQTPLFFENVEAAEPVSIVLWFKEFTSLIFYNCVVRRVFMRICYKSNNTLKHI